MIELFDKPAPTAKPRLVVGRAMADSDSEAPPTDKKERNSSLLTIADVLEIRALHAEWQRRRNEWMKFNDENNRRALAKRYGLTERYINKVIERTIWKKADPRMVDGSRKTLRGLCKWGEMALNEHLLLECPLDERRRVAQRIRRSAWAWCNRNASSRKFGVVNAVGGLIIRRVK